MQLKTFNEIHSSVNAVLAQHNPRLFRHIHPYKLLQHAIVYESIEAESKLIPHRMRLPLFLAKAYYKLRSLVRQSPKKITLKKVVMMDDGRIGTDENGIENSMFLSRLIEPIGRQNISIIKAHSRSTKLEVDVDYHDLDAYRNLPLVPAEKKVLNDLKAAYTEFKSRIHEGFLGSALQIFFEDYHKYYHLFEGQQVEQLFLITHYHQEGLIAAARDHGIQVIELQHGLIAKEDLYYVYPDHLQAYAHQCLFADKIFVFGTFWKGILLQGSGYTADQIIVAGDYSLNANKWKTYTDCPKVKGIVLGTQKNMATDYIAYAKDLLSLIVAKHPDWMLWVKLHPLEKELAAYEALASHPNCEVYGRHSNLMELLSKSKIQVSIYSTTFYDAIGLDVQNYALQHFSTGSDYAAAVVEQGVALPLRIDEDPIALFEANNNVSIQDRSAFYAEFNADILNGTP